MSFQYIPIQNNDQGYFSPYVFNQRRKFLRQVTLWADNVYFDWGVP
jgi:hypothetical protein